MSLKEILVKNTLWLLSADLLDKVISYFLIVALARTLGDVGLGEYSFVFAFAGMSFLIADLGISYYLWREASKAPNKTQKIFSNALSLKLVIIALAFALTMTLTFIISKPSQVIYSIIIFSGILAMQQIGTLFETIFQSRNKMHIVASTRILERGISLLVGLYLLLKYQSLILFFAALLVANVFKFAWQIYIGMRFVKIRLGFDKKMILEILKSGMPLWFTGVFAMIYFRIDVIMLSLMVNDQVVGWYSAAYKLIDALNFIPYIIFTATFPSMSLLFEKNKKLLSSLLNRVVRYMIYLAIPLVVGTLLLADRILQFIYGSLFSNSIIALKILIFAEALIFVTYILGTSLNAMRKEKYFTILLLSLSALNIILNFILIPRYSYVGAAFATVITELVSLVILTILVKKFLVKIRYELVKPIVAAAVMGGTVYFLRSLPIWWLIPLGMVSYFVVLYLLGLKPEDKHLLKELILKIRPAPR